MTPGGRPSIPNMRLLAKELADFTVMVVSADAPWVTRMKRGESWMKNASAEPGATLNGARDSLVPDLAIIS